MNFTIQEFWQVRLTGLVRGDKALAAGWTYETKGLPGFMEAPLAPSQELVGATAADDSSIILVSAPGAVGKSTLARQVAFETGAIYIDLAKAEPVGGHVITGGLAKSGLYASWQANTTALLIDGLDEARLRVTQEAFEAFLADVAELASGSKVPVVLFGRTGAIQDTWLILSDKGIEPAILEIGYYDLEASIEFAINRVRNTKPNTQYAATEREALDLILRRLREQTESDGDRFAGYAPVLQAVADHVAREKNPAALVALLEGGEQPVTLQTVADAILERERTKLGTLVFENPNLRQELYRPSEQLGHLAAKLYGSPVPERPAMSAKDEQVYADVLNTWVAEHPFLRTQDGASSVVFEAMIATHALKTPASAAVVIDRELARGAAANPFLAEFYIPDPSGNLPIPPGQIGIVYSSLRARLALGDSASLLVEEADEEDAGAPLRAEVEITFSRRGLERSRILRFETDQASPLRLGAYVEDVEIVAPNATVEVGLGKEAFLVAPIVMHCRKLTVLAERLIVEPSRNGDVVFLEATDVDAPQLISVPVVRTGATLSVVWPNAKQYPWTAFASASPKVEDPRIEEGLRRFRKFVIAFRSHSKGQLARYRGKIDSNRMTKGSGQRILDYMVEKEILKLDGAMYIMDADRLGQLSGATYADCVTRVYSARTVEFIVAALG